MKTIPKLTAEEVRAARELYEDTNYTKQILCPVHKGLKHTATLYQFPHRYAGIWECPVTGESDSHDCQEFESDVAYQDHWSYEREDVYQTEHPIQVCVDCLVAVDDSEF